MLFTSVLWLLNSWLDLMRSTGGCSRQGDFDALIYVFCLPQSFLQKSNAHQYKVIVEFQEQLSLRDLFLNTHVERIVKARGARSSLESFHPTFLSDAQHFCNIVESRAKAKMMMFRLSEEYTFSRPDFQSLVNPRLERSLFTRRAKR